MNGNGFISFLLRSPLHGMMSGNTLLITVTGRKTGKPITTPVNYVQESNTLWVLSSRDRTWWRNVRNGAPVTLHLRGKDCPGYAQAILAEDEVMAPLELYVRRMPMSARAIGIQIEGGEPNLDDLKRVARQKLMISVKLT